MLCVKLLSDRHFKIKVPQLDTFLQYVYKTFKSSKGGNYNVMVVLGFDHRALLVSFL